MTKDLYSVTFQNKSILHNIKEILKCNNSILRYYEKDYIKYIKSELFSISIYSSTSIQLHPKQNLYQHIFKYKEQIENQKTNSPLKAYECQEHTPSSFIWDTPDHTNTFSKSLSKILKTNGVDSIYDNHIHLSGALMFEKRWLDLISNPLDFCNKTFKKIKTSTFFDFGNYTFKSENNILKDLLMAREIFKFFINFQKENVKSKDIMQLITLLRRILNHNEIKPIFIKQSSPMTSATSNSSYTTESFFSTK